MGQNPEIKDEKDSSKANRTEIVEPRSLTRLEDGPIRYRVRRPPLPRYQPVPGKEDAPPELIIPADFNPKKIVSRLSAGERGKERIIEMTMQDIIKQDSDAWAKRGYNVNPEPYLLPPKDTKQGDLNIDFRVNFVPGSEVYVRKFDHLIDHRNRTHETGIYECSVPGTLQIGGIDIDDKGFIVQFRDRTNALLWRIPEELRIHCPDQEAAGRLRVMPLKGNFVYNRITSSIVFEASADNMPAFRGKTITFVKEPGERPFLPPEVPLAPAVESDDGWRPAKKKGEKTPETKKDRLPDRKT